MADSTRIWIAQCLCGPQRHAILAVAGEADGPRAAKVLLSMIRDQVADLLAGRLLNEWCALCNAPAREWTYEVRRSRFATMDEAEPELRKSEGDQIITNALLGDIPRND